VEDYIDGVGTSGEAAADEEVLEYVEARWLW
jgi:hypothetical protein